MIGFGTHETYAIRMMRKYNMWNSMTYKERTLYNIFDTLTINAVNNGIPKSILEESKMLYKQVSETCISRGDNRSGLIASCIYMACKNNKVPRSAKEIAKVFNLKVTTMTRGCKLFQDLMKVNVDSTTADDFVNRFCSSLQMSAEMRDICKKTVHIAEEMSYVSENTPPSIASAIIYFCNETYKWNMSKKLIAESCDISQVTMVKCYKKLIPYSDVLKQLSDPIGDLDSITSSSN
jgi:transcription initiation factor TFIIIB Brf1 subunit/transcription initiation factor TFIIB